MADIPVVGAGLRSSGEIASPGRAGISGTRATDKAALIADRERELKNACCAWEAQFIHYLFKVMRETIPEGGFIRQSTAEKTYTSLLDFQLAEELSRQGSLGLAPLLYQQVAAEMESEGEQNAITGKK